MPATHCQPSQGLWRVPPPNPTPTPLPVGGVAQPLLRGRGHMELLLGADALGVLRSKGFPLSSDVAVVTRFGHKLQHRLYSPLSDSDQASTPDSTSLLPS